MRILSSLLLFTVVLVGYTSQSQAGHATYWDYIYHEGYKHDFDPYVGSQKLKQRTEKDQDSWTPADWIDNPGDEKIILRDFYKMGILEKQYMNKKNVPVLRVGEKFIQLSGFDQNRILAFVDYVFKITESEEFGMFYVYYYREDNEPLGTYNKSGFIQY